MTTSGERADTGLQVVSKIVTVANPAAGADWLFALTAPGLLIAVNAVLTTSAVVANRVPSFKLQDTGGDEIWECANGVNQAAAQVRRYMAGATGSVANIGTQQYFFTPPGLVMSTGWAIRSNTVALDVGDQWSQIVLTFAG